MNAVVVFFSHHWLIVNTGFSYTAAAAAGHEAVVKLLLETDTSGLAGSLQTSEDWNNAAATAILLSATPFASPFRILARARNSIGNDLQNYQAL